MKANKKSKRISSFFFQNKVVPDSSIILNNFSERNKFSNSQK